LFFRLLYQNIPPWRSKRRRTKPEAEPAIIARRWVEEMEVGFDWSLVGNGPELEPEEED
jgi:hypothetical protein